jgi:hypothetical protein
MENVRSKTAGVTQQQLGLSEFERQYFLQTRQEIDTEKQERNKILNYAIVSLGVLALAIVRIDNPLAPLRSPAALCFYYPFLLLISILISGRRAKLRQIFDRWFVLRGILAARSEPKGWVSLEKVVCDGFDNKRYLAEDRLLHLGLSLIPYSLIGLVASGLRWYLAIPAVLLAMAHLIGCDLWLRRQVKRPNTTLESTVPKYPV